jgi:hypothetical protein
MAEGGRRKAEGGRQKAEGSRQKAEGGKQKAEGGRRQEAEVVGGSSTRAQNVRIKYSQSEDRFSIFHSPFFIFDSSLI